jgi:hypothetical protein
MGIKQFIKKVCVQDAVYWEFIGVDGYNTPKFMAAEPIKVRWDEDSEIQIANNGKEFTSSAKILSPIDLQEQSIIMRVSIDDLPIEPDPLEYELAFEIRRVERTPLFMSSELDVFVAYV